MTIRRLAGLVLLALLALGPAARVHSESTFEWDLPRGFPTPRVPLDNPMTPEKVALGRYLFYDTRLSSNGTQACARCHEQARAFTDGRAHAVGSTGEVHPRNSMSLANVGYAATLTWGNPTITRLEDQALVPMFANHPIELGLTRPGDALVAKLHAVPTYQRLFTAAFGDDEAITVTNVTRALASFERMVISGRSPYDRYHFARENDAISLGAKRGEQLFFSQPLSCFRCHNGFTFSGAADFEGRRERQPEYQNNGLTADSGLFKAPTLRNIAVTAPYMHDGSIVKLEAVIDAYATGGHDNANKSPIVRGFMLTGEQKSDLVAFLKTLTDTELLNDARFSNPWTRPQ
jgi:cytochrome c peroxidase